MAVTSSTLSRIGSDGSWELLGKKEYFAVYKAITDNARDQAAVVLNYYKNAGNEPYLGKTYEYANDSDQDTICTKIDPKRVENSQFQWEVTFTYETPQGEKDDKEQNKDKDGNLTDDPTQWLDKMSVDFTTIMVPVESAIYVGGMTGQSATVMEEGKVTPIVNSAFETLKPRPEEEVHISVVRRSAYHLFFDQAIANLFIGMVNNAAFQVDHLNYTAIWQPYTAKIINIGGDLELINGNIYWNNRVEVHINPLGWRRQFVDQGKNRAVRAGDPNGYGSTFSESDFVAGRAKVMPVVDAKDDPVTDDVLFDGNGQPLGQGLPTVFIKYAAPREGQFPPGLMSD